MKSIISTTTIDILTILTYMDTILDCRILQYYIFVSTLQEYNVSSLPRMLAGVVAVVLTCHILEFRTAAALGTR